MLDDGIDWPPPVIFKAIQRARALTSFARNRRPRALSPRDVAICSALHFGRYERRHEALMGDLPLCVLLMTQRHRPRRIRWPFSMMASGRPCPHIILARRMAADAYHLHFVAHLSITIISSFPYGHRRTGISLTLERALPAIAIPFTGDAVFIMTSLA